MPSSTTRRLLLASTALTTLLLATVPPAAAADATWQGTTDAFNTGTNWDTNTVPTGTAFFGASGTTTVNISRSGLGGLTFNTGAATYVFNVVGDFDLVGAGIVINGGGATFNNANGGNVFSFIGDSTAGTATIVNDGQMNFLEQ